MPILTSSVEEDDGVAIQEQICELKKECAKKNTDHDNFHLPLLLVEKTCLKLQQQQEQLTPLTISASLKFHHM